MDEIFNLITLCRCCHSDGSFKSLNIPYECDNGEEVYETMLLTVLNLRISKPPVDASYTICDTCIDRLRDATQFKLQILACEQRFQEYCANEQFINVPSLKSEVHTDSDHNCSTEISIEIEEPIETTEKINLNVKKEAHNSNTEVKKSKNNVLKVKKRVTTLKENNKKIMINKKKTKNKNIVKIKKEIQPYSIILTETTPQGVTYRCKICNLQFTTKYVIVTHIKKEHSKIFIKCENCPKRFTSNVALEAHTENFHSNSHRCTICYKDFDSRKARRTHEKRHIKSNYVCDICHKTYKSKCTLVKHVRQMHINAVQYLCDYCGWAFKQKCNLIGHIRVVHLKLRPYSCSVCKKCFADKRHFKDHMRNVHHIPTVYKCNYCDKTFKNVDTCNIHQLRHNNKFKCRMCECIFDNDDDCVCHMQKAHSKFYNKEWKRKCKRKEYNYSCHICGKLLQTKYTLERHVDTHTGIKKFSCDVCKQNFSAKASLNRHRKQHIKPVVAKTKCIICKRMVSDVEKHKISHDYSLKKFECDICGNRFVGGNTLNRHRQIHFGITFTCKLCGKVYERKKSLRTHTLKKHHIKIEDMTNT